jgi:hypothetical protein
MSLLVFAFLNFILYPSILRYQAGSRAGFYLETHPQLTTSTASVSAGMSVPIAIDAPAVAWLLSEAPVSYSFEFDAPGPVARVPIDSLPRPLPADGIIVFAPTAYGDTLVARGFHTALIEPYDYFHISQLTGEFLNYRTRAEVVTPWGLFRVKR